MIQLPEATYIRFDLFPAQLFPPLPGYETIDLRVIVTDRDLLVFGDTNIGPDLIFSSTLEDWLGRNQTTKNYEALTADQTLYEISRAPSCGCGSRLRGTRIYPDLPRRMT